MIRHYPERDEDMQNIADMLKEKGKEESNKKFIRNLLNDGQSIETIVKYTGLPKDRVEKIIEEIEY